MIFKTQVLLISIGLTISLSAAQHLFIHGDHIDEGVFLGDTSQAVNRTPQELAQFKC
jgi:hypothetical protein